MKPQVVIIGSGVAGLASSIRLAAAGFSVTVVEKNSFVGGKLSAFTLDGFHFDRGPSLFTQPANIRELFELASQKMEDFIQVNEVKLANKYHFEDGTVVNGWTNPDQFDEEVHQVLGEQRGAVKRYLKDASTIYERIGKIFLNYPLNKASTWLHPRTVKALRVTRYRHLFRSMDELNRQYFREAKTVQLFNRFATYNGSNPFVAPGMLSMIPHLEHNEGTFYPMGGMISITKALHQLALSLGVVFRLQEEVKEICAVRGTVTSVKTTKDELPADLVVSNMDAFYTYRNLLSNERKASKVLEQERSSSALIFYWGIGKQIPGIELHNIFFSKNYQDEFDDLFIRKRVHHDPTIYINDTSVMESGQAPEGKANWFVMVNAPAQHPKEKGPDITEVRQNVIAKLNRMLKTNLDSVIEAEHVWTPAGIDADTYSYMGSLYGTSSNSRMAAFFRHANESADMKGLYFVGGSVHPGGGIPLCLLGAKITAGLIVEKHRSVLN